MLNSYFKYKLDYLLIVLLSFPILFLKLGAFSLRLWDESIYATNSIEMMERGSWLVPYYNGEIDAWNTKPPMINWLQIVSMKIFGINELAIRLPSALAALGTILLVYWFLKKHFTAFIGMFGSLVLLTSVGFVTFHGARTGDTDAVLTFFITLVNLLALDLILTKQNIGKKISWIFIGLTAGFLTKSIAVLLFIPGMLIFGFIFEKQFSSGIFKNKITWIGMAGFLLIAGGFVLIRNGIQPGYVDSFLFSDIGRVGTTIEKHNEPFVFYIDNLVNLRYTYWILLFIGSFLLFFVNDENQKRKTVLQFVTVISIFYLIFISVSVTKLAWYDIPLFPIMAVNIALLLGFIVEKINLTQIKAVTIVVIMFIIPYKHVFGLSQTNHYVDFEKKNEVKERYLKLMYERNPLASDQKHFTIYHDGYVRSLDFYKIIFQKYRMTEITITDQPDFINGDEVWVSDDHLKENLESRYEFEIIETFENLNIYKINKTKNNMDIGRLGGLIDLRKSVKSVAK